MSVEWLAIFADDDITPLVGAVDASGAVIDPTFSTDPAHPRPWLEEDSSGVSATINLIEGTVTIAQFSLTVLDRRTDPADQSTGYLTSLLAASDGFSAMTMHRAVYLVQGPDGVMRVVQNGVITSVTLNADASSYTFQIRDMQERARKAALFTKLTGPTPRYTSAQAPPFIQTAGPNGVGYVDAPFYALDPIPGPLPPYGSGLVPYGPLTGYGRLQSLPGDPLTGAFPGYLLPPLVPRTAVFLRDVKGNNTVRGVIRFDTTKAKPHTGLDNVNAIALAKGYPHATIDQSQAQAGTVTLTPFLVYTDLVIFWRHTGGTTWHRIENMPYRRLDTFQTKAPGGITSVSNKYPQQVWVLNPANVGQPGTITGTIGEQPVDGHVYLQVIFATQNHQDFPSDQAAIDVLVMDNGIPSDTAPLYLEGYWGNVLKSIYDGQYTVGVLNDPEPILKVSPSAFAQLANSTPWIRGRIFAPVDDAFNWLPDNFYKPFGAVPTFDRDGLLSPIFYALPDANASLTVLDDSACVFEGSTWEMTSNGAVNEVTFTYTREFVEQNAKGANLTAAERLTSLSVPLQFFDILAEKIGGEKPVTYAPVICTSISTLDDGIVPNGDTSSELGTELAMQRWHEVQNRFRFGNQNVTLTCDRNAPGVDAIRAGDWCLVGVSWMPDFGSGTRGMNRLMQAVGVRDLDQAWKEIQLADAGPAGQPAQPPTLGAITAQPDGTIAVEVTAVQAGTKCVVQCNATAAGSAQPTTSDGNWRFLGATQTTQTLFSLPMPSGAVVWVHARSESAGGSGSTGTGGGSQTPGDLNLTPGVVSVAHGSNVTVVSTLVDTNGAPIAGRAMTASTNDPGLATVSPALIETDANGQVTLTVHGVAPGLTTLFSTTAGLTAHIFVTVT